MVKVHKSFILDEIEALTVANQMNNIEVECAELLVPYFGAVRDNVLQN